MVLSHWCGHQLAWYWTEWHRILNLIKEWGKTWYQTKTEAWTGLRRWKVSTRYASSVLSSSSSYQSWFDPKTRGPLPAQGTHPQFYHHYTGSDERPAAQTYNQPVLTSFIGMPLPSPPHPTQVVKPLKPILRSYLSTMSLTVDGVAIERRRLHDSRAALCRLQVCGERLGVVLSPFR